MIDTDKTQTKDKDEHIRCWVESRSFFFPTVPTEGAMGTFVSTKIRRHVDNINTIVLHFVKNIKLACSAMWSSYQANTVINNLKCSLIGFFSNTTINHQSKGFKFPIIKYQHDVWQWQMKIILNSVTNLHLTWYRKE